MGRDDSFAAVTDGPSRLRFLDAEFRKLAWVSKHPKLGVSQRVDLGLFLDPEVGVETPHQFLGRTVIDLPKAGDDASCTCDVKGSLESRQTFAAGDRAESRLAGGENDEFHATQGRVFDLGSS